MTATIPVLEQVNLSIEGMTCSACVVRLEKMLQRAPGISEAIVNLPLEMATVRFDPDSEGIDSVVDIVERTGFVVGTLRSRYRLGGTVDQADVADIRELLEHLPGVVGCELDLTVEQLTVTVFAKTITNQEIVNELGRNGFDVVPMVGSDDPVVLERSRVDKEKRTVIVASLLTIPLVVQMIFQFFGYEDWHLMASAEVVLATPLQIIFGRRFYRGAFNALRGGSANMDVLVVLGTTTAYIYSWYLLVTLGEAADGEMYFEASAVIITLVIWGKYLETKAKRATTQAIRRLLDMRPNIALVEDENGIAVERSVDQIQLGEIVISKPGEQIPVDGEIREGLAEIDESLLTGESKSIRKTTGDLVTGGSINIDGNLRIVVSAIGEDSILQKIVRLVESAQIGKAGIQKLVDRVSEVFVPGVVIFAVITFVGWWLIGGDLEDSIINGVCVLVIACPCALGLATPTAIMTGTGAAARAGILFKNVTTLEEAHALDRLVFDKTGTLTLGKPVLIDYVPIGQTKVDVLRVAASLQMASEHPIAFAFVEALKETGQSALPITSFRAHVAEGVEGTIQNQRYCLGNERLLQREGLQTPHASVKENESVVWLSSKEGVVGKFVITDSLRDESKQAVDQLKKLGMIPMLLSGDSSKAVESVAQKLGIDDYVASATPLEKATAVESMIEEGYKVGMVGDGINDAPALATATVGFAMGSGTDMAIETSPVTIMRSDLRLIGSAIEISRLTFRKIKQNLFWAFIYNVIMLPLAAIGYLSPTLAGAAMALSSVSVVTNSLWLRSWRPHMGDN